MGYTTICAGGSGVGGSCGLGGAISGTWSGCNSTSTSIWGWGPGCGGSTTLACSVALVFMGLCIVGSLGAGGPLFAISHLV